MKCPMCKNEMELLEQHEKYKEYSPAIVYRTDKSYYMNPIEKIMVCGSCGFIAHFFNPDELTREDVTKIK